LPQSAQATCVTTAQSVAAASTAATVLNTEVPSTDSNTAASTPVLVQDTCGGDDVSYQVALPTSVNFQGETYTAVMQLLIQQLFLVVRIMTFLITQ